jgi:hypothetical protein
MDTQTQTQSHTDTFAALSDCFSTDLAALISEEAPQNATPTDFIDLVERVRDALGTASVGYLQDAHEDLDDAVTHLTDVLTSPAGDQRSLFSGLGPYASAGRHRGDPLNRALSALCAAPTPHPPGPGRSQWPLNHEHDEGRWTS